MADTVNAADKRESPLAPMQGRFGGAGDAIVEPIGFHALVNLRGRPDDDGFLKAVEQAFGVSLPLEPNTWNGNAERAALWLGPDEWLLMAPDGEARGIEDAIRAARGDDPWLSVVDLSHNFTGLAVAGPASRELLSKGCPLDLHERVFNGKACAQSILAKTRVLLRLVDETPRFELWVRNSFARYTAEWLLDAVGEYRAR